MSVPANVLVLLGLVLPLPQLLPPTAPVRVVAGFHAPEQAYGRGHRGVDFASRPGQTVESPVSGTVTYAGSLADRGVIAIRSGDRVVSLEPVIPSVAVGAVVFAGQAIGYAGSGGHCGTRCIHVGLRVAGAYVAPYRTRARLIPWVDPLR